jgi:hypothetical protein
MEKLEILTATLPQQVVGRKDRIRKAARRFLQLVANGLTSGPYGNRFRSRLPCLGCNNMQIHLGGLPSGHGPGSFAVIFRAAAAIARSQGWSERTTQRRIHRLMNQLGASTRFQASLTAARRGWL